MPGSVRSHPISGSEASRSSLNTVSSASSASQLFAKPTHPPRPSPSSSYSYSSSSSAVYRASLAKPDSQTCSDADLAVNTHRPLLSITSPSSSNKTPSISGRSSAGSSSEDTLITPTISRPSSSASLPLGKETSTSPNASDTPVASERRRPSSTLAPTAAKTKAKMLDDDFSLPPISVSASPSGTIKSNRILGPDGQLYTQGEAAKLGLIIRTACEACRNRKLKCSGTLPENGGCERCNSDGIQCVYSARAPIGRPKKRKAEEGEDVKCTPGPFSSSPTVRSTSQTGVKGKAKSKVTPPSVTARVKTEETAFIDSPLTAQDRYVFATSPALHHVQNSAYRSELTRLSASPAHSDKLQRHSSHDGHQAAFMAPNTFGLYEDPTQTTGLPVPSGSSSRLASTPTVWSQSQIPFAMTPTDTMTPHSVISPALASTSFPNASQNPTPAKAQPSSSAAAKLPSLDDLSVAAFLQSLDTLEISPAELFQQQQQQHLFSGETSSFGTPIAANAYGLGTPFDTTNTTVGSNMNQVTASSVEQWATSSAILQPGLSFAVPADFSWWDLGINGADFGGSATASVAATPSTEPKSFTLPTDGGGAAQPAMAATLSHRSHETMGDRQSATAHSSPAATVHTGRSRRPTFSADQLWPRGADAGMGQGQIQHTIAATETGLGWSTLPGPNHVLESLSSPTEDQAKEVAERSCCSSKSTKTASLSPSIQQSGKVEQNAEKASCCSSKSASKMPSDETTKSASCCADKNKKTSYTPPLPKEETRSCCSGHSLSTAPAPSTSEHQIEMGPLSTSAAVTGAHGDLDSERKRHAALHSHHPSKVHCVPNPSGKGCTCLCDMSVALLSVKQVLRETDLHKPPSTSTSETRNTFATNTIQLTLTASQAITAQCACSADCPTCQSDPSTEISASLLVSTALQIYARAVRILREGFAASAIGTGGGKVESTTTTTTTATAAAAAAQSFFGGLDVTIGTYKPSASNAKKIALYAIKLELKDLRRALGKISRMAQTFNSASKLKDEVVSDKGQAGATEEVGEQGKGYGMNPIDQLVILKLYRQLTELLKTVEGLEEAA
ncbi:uncharacterized protein UTRI_04444 [Ustilago trichophora]|uniref:Zn(2)-C6 fungal-type domain-containing protein n=1 Tax=Ustilago trichophora TaxID=86804 RepID=A0A5C3EG02_9BASI|nr:uncharacterized protein UTRI_04444 [Ustilago trichophora]